MNPRGLEPLLRESLRSSAATTVRDVEPDDVAAARARLSRRLDHRRTARRTLAAGGVLAAALVAGFAVLAWPSDTPRDAVPPASAVTPQPAASLLIDAPGPATVPDVSPTTAASITGDPVPGPLRGRWTARVVVEGQPTRATLTLTDQGYALCTGPAECLTGSVAVQGETLVFHDEQWCGVDGVAGAGRYAWQLTGSRLALSQRGDDPCYRSPTLADAAWSR